MWGERVTKNEEKKAMTIMRRHVRLFFSSFFLTHHMKLPPLVVTFRGWCETIPRTRKLHVMEIVNRAITFLLQINNFIRC